jgi:metallo-beta-lactamase class B
MKLTTKTVLFVLCFLTNLVASAQENTSFEPKVVYKSETLIVTQISPKAFVHTTFLQTQEFGNVPCNGLVVSDLQEAIVFDTPADDQGSVELIKWIKEKLHCKINAIIPTHFHNDCLGGLQAFHKERIASYANVKTIKLASANRVAVPQNGFKDSLLLQVGKQYVVVKFLGEGHTKDNVVGYFPGEDILFGGCLIKEIDANKGFLGDANVAAWSNTVEKVKQQYPNVKIVVPGHGAIGNQQLLDYTIKLFQPKQQ